MVGRKCAGRNNSYWSEAASLDRGATVWSRITAATSAGGGGSLLLNGLDEEIAVDDETTGQLSVRHKIYDSEEELPTAGSILIASEHDVSARRHHQHGYHRQRSSSSGGRLLENSAADKSGPGKAEGKKGSTSLTRGRSSLTAAGGVLAWLDLMSDCDVRYKSSKSDADDYYSSSDRKRRFKHQCSSKRSSRCGFNQEDAASAISDESTDIDETVTGASIVPPPLRNDSDNISYTMTRSTRADFVDEILEASIRQQSPYHQPHMATVVSSRRPRPKRRSGHISRGSSNYTNTTSRPYIQSEFGEAAVLVSGAEPLHLSHAMRRRHHVFHCYEFLLMCRLDRDAELWTRLCDRYGHCDECKAGCRAQHPPADHRQKDILRDFKNDLWYLGYTLRESRDKLIHFIRSEMPKRKTISQPANESREQEQEPPFGLKLQSDSFLTSYLHSFNFVELNLDNILERGVGQLPSDIFRCPNVKSLSLKNNFLEWLSPEVGRMGRLERLMLTNNLLKNQSIPLTLGFCSRLREVYFDNNLLDALPCILLRMKSLERVYRHGNHNYFKATFMFYHTDIYERILGYSVKGERGSALLSLQELAARQLLSTRRNFYALPAFPPRLKDYLTQIAQTIELCNHCSKPMPFTDSGYKVFSFKNPYLGNTCVPFLHVACSMACARAIEIPARHEQQLSARRQDREYEQYVQESLSYLEGKEQSPGTSSCSTLRRRSGRATATSPGSSRCSSLVSLAPSSTSTPASNCGIL